MRDMSSLIPQGSPTKATGGENETDPENHILKSFAHMASMSPAAIVDKRAVTPAAMGQTMSAKQSKAMVEMVKSQASIPTPSKSQGSSGWLRRTFHSDKEYEKQRAEFVEEIKKLASLRHQYVSKSACENLTPQPSSYLFRFLPFADVSSLSWVR